MSLLSEYEKRTAWKYNAITGRFSTHPALINKVDAAGRFVPFLGSTVVFKLDRRVCQYLQCVSGILQEKPRGMMAQPIPGSAYHLTLHDLISPEQTDATAVFTDEARTAYTAEYLREVALSLVEAEKRADEIRSDYSGRRIQMRADRVVSMVSKSIVLMLRPATEEDYSFLLELYRRFDDIKNLPYPLTPHVTLAYFKPGEIDGDQLAEAIKLIQVEGCDPMTLELSVEGLFAQRFDDMGHYVDVPERICFCCDGGMNRSVMAAAILNHEAKRRRIPIRADARSAFPNIEGHSVPPDLIDTLAGHGILSEGITPKAQHLKKDDYVAFSSVVAMTGGALMRCTETGIPQDAYAMRSGLFLNLPDPQYGASYEAVYAIIHERVDRFLDDRAMRNKIFEDKC